MATQSEILKFLIQGDSKSATAAMKELNAELTGTETAGQRVAAQIKAMSAIIDAEAARAEGAVSALSSALGSEFVGDLERSGGSVRDVVARLETAGLTMDDIRNDADALGAALRDAGSAGERFGVSMGSSAARAETGLGRVRTEADQSRSVLANMVGNSVQDLGQLGGVAGSAGVMIGQLGEYAADGNIALGSLVKFAGPMAAIAAVTSTIAFAFQAQKRAAEEAAREVKALAEVQKLLAEGDIAGAAKSLAEEYADTIPLLEKYGLTADDLVQSLNGSSDAADTLRERSAQLGRELSGANGTRRMEIAAEQRELGALIGTLQEAESRSMTAAEQDQSRTENIVKVNEALYANIDLGDRANNVTSDHASAATIAAASLDAQAKAEEETAAKTDAYRAAQQKAAEAVQKRIDRERKLYDEQLSRIDSERAYKAAVDSGEQALADFNTTLADHSSSLEEIDDAARSAEDTLIGQAEAFAKSKGAADGTRDSIRLQAEELFRLAVAMDPNSPLRARLVEYINELGRIPTTVSTQLNLSISGGQLTTRDGDIIGQRKGGKADGGPTSARSMYEIVERGNPEVYTEGGRTYLLTGNSDGRVVALDRVGGGPSMAGTVAAGTYAISRSGGTATAGGSGSAKSEDQIKARMFETGDIALADYRTYLEGRQAAMEQYSDEWMAAWRQIRQLNKEEADENKRALDDAKKAADEAAAAARKQADDEKKAADAAKAASDAKTRQAYDEAAARKELADARKAADDAWVAMDTNAINDPLNWGFKQDDLNRKFVQSLLRRADAAANASGIQDGTVEWARAVRSALLGDKANDPRLGPYIDDVLAGIPELAAGGIARATTGGTIVRVAEAGKDEAIIPLDDRRARKALGAGGTTVIVHGNMYGESVLRQQLRQADADARWRQRLVG